MTSGTNGTRKEKKGPGEPNITPSSDIQISNWVKVFQRFNPEWLEDNNTGAILHKQLPKYYNIRYDIVYDIVYDIIYHTCNTMMVTISYTISRINLWILVPKTVALNIERIA